MTSHEHPLLERKDIKAIASMPFALALVPLNLKAFFNMKYWNETIDIEYNKRLDRQRPCFEDELTGGSNDIVQSNKSV